MGFECFDFPAQFDGESSDNFLQYETPFYMKKALEFRHLSR